MTFDNYIEKAIKAAFKQINLLNADLPEHLRVEIIPGRHFIQRWEQRIGNIDELVPLAKLLNDQYCMLLYFANLSIPFPDRGKIQQGNLVVCTNPCTHPNKIILQTVFRRN